MGAEFVVGFTGSRSGLSEIQREAIRSELTGRMPTRVVHGDCIGADADFHEIARELGIPIKLRPCTLNSQRAFCEFADTVLGPVPPLVRNRAIVDEVDLLIAAPDGPEKLRSGTWSTIRYARKTGKRHWLVS